MFPKDHDLTIYLTLFFAISLTSCGVSRSFKGKQAFAAGQYDRAVFSLRSALRDHPNDQKAWTQLGLANYRLGKMPEAKYAFEHAFRLDPKDIRSGVYLATIAAHTKDYPLGLKTTEVLLDQIDDAKIELAIARLKFEMDEKAKTQLAEQIIEKKKVRESIGTVVMPIANIDASSEIAATLTYFIVELIEQKIEPEIVIKILDQTFGETLVDPMIGMQIGLMISAEKVITGKLIKNDDNLFRLDLTQIFPKTGEFRELEALIGTEIDLANQLSQLVLSEDLDSASLLSLLDLAKGRYHYDRDDFVNADRFFQFSMNRTTAPKHAKTYLKNAQILQKISSAPESRKDLASFFEQIGKISMQRKMLLKITHDRFNDVDGVRDSGDQKFPGTDLVIQTQLK